MGVLARFKLTERQRLEVHGRGDTVGAAVRAETSTATVHPTTIEQRDLVVNLIRELRALGAIPECVFTSLHILHNCSVDWHVDQNPAESIIVAVGDFDDGELEIDYGEKIERVNIMGYPFRFDDSTRHRVRRFRGDRWPITIYTHHRAHELDAVQQTLLKSMGFMLTRPGFDALDTGAKDEGIAHIEFGASFIVFHRALTEHGDIGSHVFLSSCVEAVAIAKRCYPSAVCVNPLQLVIITCRRYGCGLLGGLQPRRPQRPSRGPDVCLEPLRSSGYNSDRDGNWTSSDV